MRTSILLAMCLLLASSASAQSVPDCFNGVGVFLEATPSPVFSYTDYMGPTDSLTAYVVLVNPYNENTGEPIQNVGGFEFRLSFPDELFDLSPFYMNLLENHVTVQFFHRMTAYAVLISVFGLYLSSRKPGISDQISLGSFSLLIVTLLQVALGIWTLLAVVPVTLGVLHQAGGLTVLGISTFLLHELRREK